jgi:hypothetical protein
MAFSLALHNRPFFHHIERESILFSLGNKSLFCYPTFHKKPDCVFRICFPVSALGPPQLPLRAASVYALWRLVSALLRAPQLPLRAASVYALWHLFPALLRAPQFRLHSASFPLCTRRSLQRCGTEQGTSTATERPSGGAAERRSGKRRRMSMVSGNMLCRQQNDGL